MSSSIQLCILPISRDGVPLRIHYLWLLFIVFSAFPAFYTSTIVGIYCLIFTGPILFATILLHEMGHAFMAMQLGGEVRQILIWPLGGLTYVSFFGDSNPRADALIAVAGPLTHIPQFLAWSVAMYVSTGGTVVLSWPIDWGYNFWLALCSASMLLQITLFIFNLIPAYPLDGGRLLGALLSWLDFNRNTVFKVTAFVGSIFGWFFLFEGLRSTSSASFTIYSSGNEMAVGAFILMNCLELWVLGAREAATQHPGFEWVDERQQHLAHQPASTTHSGVPSSVPTRGVRNIHGPGDAPVEQQLAHSGRSSMLYSTGDSRSGNADRHVDHVAHKMPGVGHRVGSADAKV